MFGAFKASPITSVGLLWYALPFPLCSLLLSLCFISIYSSLALFNSNRKMPYRLSKTRKFRQRLRLKSVDSVIATLSNSLPQNSITPIASLVSSALSEPAQRVASWFGDGIISQVQAHELPTEQEMRPKDKYTTFSRKETGYRKGIHKVPQWTKVTDRLNPKGF